MTTVDGAPVDAAGVAPAVGEGVEAAADSAVGVDVDVVLQPAIRRSAPARAGSQTPRVPPDHSSRRITGKRSSSTAAANPQSSQKSAVAALVPSSRMPGSG